MQIKHFDFPTFEEWDKNYHDCRIQLGCYNCHICIYSSTNKTTTYAFGISANENPLNVYAETIYHSYFHCGNDDKSSVKEWYEKTIKEAKEAWERHILKTYFEN